MPASRPPSRIDLNADLGESFGSWTMGDDRGLLEVVTSANIACGFHAGDPSVMRTTLAAAADRGVAVGAHVSYRDLAGFGRRFIDICPDELHADVSYQLSALAGMAGVAGVRLRHVKPHGALYHAMQTHPGQAEAVVAAVAEFDRDLVLLGMPGIGLELATEAGLAVAVEVFADRAYTAAGGLVPRSQPGAVLHDADEVARRMVRLVTQSVVTTVEGTELALMADSICVHGDSPGAVTMATRLRQVLEQAGVELAPFVGRR